MNTTDMNTTARTPATSLRRADRIAVVAVLAGSALLGSLPGWATSADAATVKRPKTPVLVGGEEDLDACGGTGKVVGLSSGKTGFLSVRSTPSTKGAELDRLRNGAMVNLCDE